tara:strand:- start:5317 stop:5613 length:297 start_codon:yes stop_codon:yes gene_type:complete
MTLKDIKGILYLKDLLQEPSILTSVDFEDKTVSFTIKTDDGLLHELVLISKDMFFIGIKVVDILESRKISYLSYTIYIESEGDSHDVIEQHEFKLQIL